MFPFPRDISNRDVRKKKKKKNCLLKFVILEFNHINTPFSSLSPNKNPIEPSSNFIQKVFEEDLVATLTFFPI